MLITLGSGPNPLAGHGSHDLNFLLLVCDPCVEHSRVTVPIHFLLVDIPRGIYVVWVVDSFFSG